MRIDLNCPKCGHVIECDTPGPGPVPRMWAVWQQAALALECQFEETCHHFGAEAAMAELRVRWALAEA